MSQILTDEVGQAFQLKDSDSQEVTGKECLFANINTVNSIATFLSTSLGPTGMDKILISKDDIVTVTNDGATILNEMEMTNNPISQLVLQLSQSQDEEIGDGTTSIVILASSILNQAKKLIEKGMHPIKITEGFNLALNLAIEHLDRISEEVTDMSTYLLKAAKTSLGSKIVSLGDISGLCVDAALAVADLPRKDLDLELINIQSKPGKSISDTVLIKGIVLKKEFSHPQMGKEFKNAKIALLSCPFEPPRLKNKNSLLIHSAEEYKKVEKYEKSKFLEMIAALKNSKADLVMCQWGFDDEANSLLMQNSLPAVRWVGGHDLGHMAAHIGGSIISRFEDLKEEHLGLANVREESLGTDSSKIIIVESPSKDKSVTILIRGSTEYIIEEAKRSIRDALCAIRNLIRNNRIVYGGGSCELSMSLHLKKAAKEYVPEEEEAIVAFANSLLEIPILLAKNSGHEPISYVEKLTTLHSSETDYSLGVDCLETGERSMKKMGIFEALESKTRQIKMAIDLANVILKISDVILI